jgi:hypothetical protein
LWVPTTCPPQASWMYSWISHRDDRPGEPAHRLLRRVAGRLPAAVPGRVPGGADAGCSAPHRPTARSPAVVDLGAASVQQLTTDRADPPLGEGVRSRCPHWRPQDPDALGGEDRIEGVGDPGVPVAQQEPERLDAVRQVHEEGTGLLGDPFPGWVGRHAEDVDPAIGDLQHEQHVQALEQDGLSMEQVAGQDPSAWAARNCCQVRLARRGAGSIPPRLRRSHTVLGARFCPSRASSPWMHRWPHVGLSAAIGRIRRRSSGTVEGRLGWRCGNVQRRLIRSRCQPSTVSGVTNRWSRCCFGSRRVNAARTARSGQKERGRLTCRRKTATSWRKRRISAFLDACARASSPSQPKSWQKIR